MTRKPPPHRRKRDPFRRQVLGVYHAPKSVPPPTSDQAGSGGTPKPTTVHEWAVRHLGYRDPIPYDTEDEARTAAGTAGTLLHWGEEVP